MARDYWVDPKSGQYVRTTHTTTRTHHHHHSKLKRSNTHDGSSQSSRSRRVDFVDVTRKEYKALLAREQSLRVTNDELTRQNWALQANYNACCDENKRLQAMVQNLEYENSYLKAAGPDAGYYGGGYGRDRACEDELRKLRNKNTRLLNDNDSLLAKIKSLQRNVRGGLRDGARRLGDDLSHWKHKVTKLEDDNERLHHKLDSVQQRCKRLETTNESLARNERKWRREVDSYEAWMRRHGYSLRS